MSDVTSTAALAAGASALGYPVLTALGIDPAAVGWGFVGAIVAQSLLPQPPNQTVKASVFIMLGSMLFAAAVAPWLTMKLAARTEPDFPFILAPVSMVCASLAQPILQVMKVRVGGAINKLLDHFFGGTPNA